MDAVRAISFTADFYPEDLPQGLITWTFIATTETAIGAGLYELRFLRTLTDEERAEGYPATLAKPREQAQ